MGKNEFLNIFNNFHFPSMKLKPFFAGFAIIEPHIRVVKRSHRFCLNMIKLFYGCYFGYKSTILLLMTVIIMKHYFFGYVHNLRVTYDVFQAYISQENDTFFDDVSWINEQHFSDFVDEKSLSETNLNVKKPIHYYPRRIKPICRADLSKHFLLMRNILRFEDLNLFRTSIQSSVNCRSKSTIRWNMVSEKL